MIAPTDAAAQAQYDLKLAENTGKGLPMIEETPIVVQDVTDTTDATLTAPVEPTPPVVVVDAQVEADDATNTGEPTDDDDDDKAAEVGKKSAKPYFAVYYNPELAAKVEAARGTESANTYIGSLLYAHFGLVAPVRKSRSKYESKEAAKAAAEKNRKDKAAVMKMLAEKYAAEMAEAMAKLKGE